MGTYFLLGVTMIKYVAILVCVAVAFGAEIPLRERRQVACTEPVVNNVCQQGLNGPLHFPHPTDSSKFLQCAPGGRMFIIKCPMNEIYHQDTTSCGSVQPVVTAPPQTLPPVTVAPVTQAPSTNPCTAQNLASGNIFFPYPSDNKKFIECNAQGQPLILSCPTRLVYDPSKTGCVLPSGSTLNTGGSTQTGSPIVNPGTNTGTVTVPNPGAVAGNGFIKQCPANLVWNQAISRCDTPYNLAQTQN